MEQYAIYFAALLFFNAALTYHRRQVDKHAAAQESLTLPSSENLIAATRFKWEYFSLWTLVMAADWLQGPYMYTLYKHEKGISEQTVAALFTTGYVTAGITASFVGSLADRYGRKAGCLTFCVAYGASCLSVLSNDIAVLFAGRALGGLSTTLLYSVFETWMISEYHRRDLRGNVSLGSIFSTQITLSSIVAIGAGVTGEGIVRYSGTKTAPFMASFVCLALAFVGIQQLWTENYGEVMTEKGFEIGGLRTILADRRIVALTVTTTLFEGSMYLFVFFWSPALISAHSESRSDAPLPFGLIFSCFMCAVMLGSTFFGLLKIDSARHAGHLMLSILAMASYGLLIPVLQQAEGVTFWSFMLFEMCVGLYFPSMSRLKSGIVDDAVRARVYGFMRLPLNIFIAVALGTTRDGVEHRSRVFTVTGGLLLFVFWVVRRCLV